MEVLHAAEFETPMGSMRCVSSAIGLVYVELPSASGRGLHGWMATHAPGAQVLDGFAPNRKAVKQLTEYFDGKRESFELSLDMRATAFQLQVYDAVAAIPYGATRSYAQVAEQIGRPSAVRAVGAANGANPIPIIVPCHRVIASGGKLQGYAGGLDMKARLLAMEGAHHPPTDRLF